MQWEIRPQESDGQSYRVERELVMWYMIHLLFGACTLCWETNKLSWGLVYIRWKVTVAYYKLCSASTSCKLLCQVFGKHCLHLFAEIPGKRSLTQASVCNRLSTLMGNYRHWRSSLDPILLNPPFWSKHCVPKVPSESSGTCQRPAAVYL